MLKELCEEGKLLKVYVDGIKENFYIRAEDAKMLSVLEEGLENKVSFLAPLDNLLWDRKLVKDIFDFDYSWEVYIPIEKRKYGYYVLPVLYGDRLVARFEPEVHRGTAALRIKNWWWEDNFIPTNEAIKSILEAFTRFCSFLGSSGLPEKDYDKIIKSKK
jgi:uncharacterized protein YcaQ